MLLKVIDVPYFQRFRHLSAIIARKDIDRYDKILAYRTYWRFDVLPGLFLEIREKLRFNLLPSLGQLGYSGNCRHDAR